MDVLIIRPIGTRNGIDFDAVEQQLIRPALARLQLPGRSFEQTLDQGELRQDTFYALLTADLVIADVTIDYAEGFYILGVRHALRQKMTVLIRAAGAAAGAFGLSPDRQLTYVLQHPAAAIDDLVERIEQVRNAQKIDSPIFHLLPDMPPRDLTAFLALPEDFKNEFEEAVGRKDLPKLRLLADEVSTLFWRRKGLNTIGLEQRRLEDWTGARETLEKVIFHFPEDVPANIGLGTVYQRLDDLIKANQRLSHLLRNSSLTPEDRAEIYALQGRNEKDYWVKEWQKIGPLDERQRQALTAGTLDIAFKLYLKGFTEDRNHDYSGINALMMATITLKLAEFQPEEWLLIHDSEREANRELETLQELRRDLEVAVRLAIETRLQRAEQAGVDKSDELFLWAKISQTDLYFCGSSSPRAAAARYSRILGELRPFHIDAIARQIKLFWSLGIFTEKAEAVLTVLDRLALIEQLEAPVTAVTPPHVILFTGHRIDEPGRTPPRFPAEKADMARALIQAAVADVVDTVGDIPLLAISGAASGGDLLFQEVCQAMDLQRLVLLPFDQDTYSDRSVAAAGPEWVRRYRAVVGSSQLVVLNESSELPGWLKEKQDYSIWQRFSNWAVHNALTYSEGNLTLISLWDQQKGNGRSGARHMHLTTLARASGAVIKTIDARKLLGTSTIVPHEMISSQKLEPAAATPTLSKSELRSRMDQRLSLSDIRQMVFDLNIDYENIEGNIKSEKIVSLIRFVERRNMNDLLMQLLANDFRHVLFDEES